MKVALVHDWLNGMRGGEKCLESLCHIFPSADVFTLFYTPGRLTPTIESRRIRTSFLQRLPLSHRYYRYLLPLYPYAVEAFDLKGYDLVVSLSHCAAKGVRTPPGARHVCYCLTPMRYLWDLYDVYFAPERTGWATRAVLGWRRGALRRWDLRTSERVDRFVGISAHVVERILRLYGRRADLIYPPVNTDFFRPPDPPPPREDFYLVVSALAPYKRVDLAIEAASRLGRRLKIIGTGQDEARLKQLAASRGGRIEFLGWASDETVRDAYARCRALLFPGEEDFGIAPVEANAMGAPVVAYGKGGASETIVPLGVGDVGLGHVREGGRVDPTGVLFPEQTAESMRDAIARFERSEHRFRPAALRARALRFDRRIFEEAFRQYVQALATRPAAEPCATGAPAPSAVSGPRPEMPRAGERVERRGFHSSEDALPC